jgi:hypothetical protein
MREILLRTNISELQNESMDWKHFHYFYLMFVFDIQSILLWIKYWLLKQIILKLTKNLNNCVITGRNTWALIRFCRAGRMSSTWMVWNCISVNIRTSDTSSQKVWRNWRSVRNIYFQRNCCRTSSIIRYLFVWILFDFDFEDIEFLIRSDIMNDLWVKRSTERTIILLFWPLLQAFETELMSTRISDTSVLDVF